MTDRRKKIGNWGEQFACDYLIQHGYKIMDRNVVTPHGEIDILAKKEQRLIFIEVKTRTNEVFGFPETSLTPRKLSHMQNAALFYIQNNEYEGDWQLDAISILRKGNDHPDLILFENVSP